MTLRHLRIFKEVCELKSVTKAANKLYIAQPAVSVAIAELEKKYDVKLFQRIKNRMVITSAGKQLYERALTVLNNFDDFESTAYESGKTCGLKIGASLTIGTFLLPAMIKKIREFYPAVRLQIKIFPKNSVEKMVLTGELDFGLVENSVTDAHLDAREFFEDKLVAVCSPDYPAPEKLRFKDADKYDFILRESGSASREKFEQLAKKNSAAVTPFIETVNPQAAESCAAAGLGIAVLPLSMVRARLDRGELRTVPVVDADFKRSYCLITHKQKVFSSLQKEITELCVNMGKEYKSGPENF